MLNLSDKTINEYQHFSLDDLTIRILEWNQFLPDILLDGTLVPYIKR